MNLPFSKCKCLSFFFFFFFLWAGQNGNWLTFGGNITENTWNKSDRWPSLCALWGQVFTVKSVASGLPGGPVCITSAASQYCNTGLQELGSNTDSEGRWDMINTERATDLHLFKAQEKKSNTAILRGREWGRSSWNKDDHATEEGWNCIHKLTRRMRKS